jgi:hypothetical protein
MKQAQIPGAEQFGLLRAIISLRSNRMWKLLRYYWLTAKGYRLNPWNSPYLRWRFETYLGAEAADMTASKFFKLTWKHRDQMERFLDWATERRQIQRRKP